MNRRTAFPCDSLKNLSCNLFDCRKVFAWQSDNLPLPANWLVGEVCYQFVSDPHIDGEKEETSDPQPDESIDAFELQVVSWKQPQTLKTDNRATLRQCVLSDHVSTLALCNF